MVKDAGVSKVDNEGREEKTRVGRVKIKSECNLKARCLMTKQK